MRISSRSSTGSGNDSSSGDAVDGDRVREKAGHVAALRERHAVVEAEQVGILRVLVLDDDGDVLERRCEIGRELVERGADVVVERHRMTSAINAFCVCRRFSACSQARQRGPYRTSDVISSPTCAGDSASRRHRARPRRAGRRRSGTESRSRTTPVAIGVLAHARPDVGVDGERPADGLPRVRDDLDAAAIRASVRGRGRDDGFVGLVARRRRSDEVHPEPPRDTHQ